MGRCNSCYAIVKKHDRCCYVCGDRVPRRASVVQSRKNISLASNLLFMVSLAFSFYCFFASEKLSLAVSLAISGGLLGLRMLADRHTGQSEIPRPNRQTRATRQLAARITLT